MKIKPEIATKEKTSDTHFRERIKEKIALLKKNKQSITIHSEVKETKVIEDQSTNSKKDNRLGMPIENKKKFHIVADCILSIDKTTIMIQNIPNKYNKELMLELIDRKFAGKYDFFYLPIDMKFQCNVGYAFINFINQKVLLHFFNEFHNIKWPNFNSEKICHLSYARL